MAIHYRIQQDSVLRSKRGKSLVDSPVSSSSPSSRREKTKSKVSRFRDVYVLNNLRWILIGRYLFFTKHFHGSYNFFGVPIFVFVYSNCLDLLWASGYLYFTSLLFCYKYLFSVCKCKLEINCLIPNTSVWVVVFSLFFKHTVVHLSYMSNYDAIFLFFYLYEN